MSQKSIAFFDFDGTITTADTLLELIKFQKGTPGLVIGFLINILYIILYKLHIVSNQTAKEKILKYYWKGLSEYDFNELCDAFSADQLPQLIRPKAQEEIEKLISQGFEIVIVSASPENWINKWAAGVRAQVIASNLEVIDRKLTGRLKGKNCHGIEKVRRIREQFNLSEYQQIFTYGDTKGDIPMLSLGHIRFYKPFR